MDRYPYKSQQLSENCLLSVFARRQQLGLSFASDRHGAFRILAFDCGHRADDSTSFVFGSQLPMYQKQPSSCLNRKDQSRSEEHTSELQSRFDLVCRLLLEKKKQQQ